MFATNVREPNIATLLVKRGIDQNIRKNVRDYTMKRCLENHLLKMEIAPSASFGCHQWIMGEGTCLAAER